MNENINNFKNHLEFLGYIVTEDGVDDGKFLKALTGTGSSRPNLVLWFGKLDSNRVIFSSNWKKDKEVNTIEQFKFMNDVNDKLVAKMFINKDGDLNFTYIYTGEYNKKLTGDFIDTFISCISQTMAKDEFKKLFIKS